MNLKVAHLYPKVMNIYGDRGNIMAIARRCRLRGITVTVDNIEVGDTLASNDYDLFFIGGAQDKEQERISKDLSENKGESLKDAVENGSALLAVCGGYQLMGSHYRISGGKELMGVGLFVLILELTKKDNI